MNLLNSASKVVFVLMCLATIAGLFLGKIDAKDFMVLASMAFTYYFTAKVSSNSPSTDDIVGGK